MRKDVNMLPEVATDLEPSTESDSQDVTEPSSSSDVEQSLEDAILSAVDGNVVDDDQYEEEVAEGVASDSSPDGEEEGSPDSEVEGDPQPEAAEHDDDAFIQMLRDKDVPLGKIERFQELIHDRQNLRAENEELGAVRTQLDDLTNHARRAGLNDEQLANWFSMPILLANDPVKAQELIQGFLADMGVRTGATLPEDLQAKVDDGYMDLDTAKDYAKTRAELQATKDTSEYDRQERERETQTKARNGIISAVNARQQHFLETDPDYSPQKHRLVQNELAAIAKKQGQPTTAEQGVELADLAHKNVTEALGDLRPKRKPARTLRGRGGNRPAAAEPKTMFEAITNAVNNPE